MEISWFNLLVTFCLCAALKSLVNLLQHSTTTTTKTRKLPPGPPTVPILSVLQWLLKSFADIENTLIQLSAKYGSIFTVFLGRRPTIFITEPSVAHRALIRNGAAFADRPPANETHRIMSSNQHTVSSARYGPLWRLLRRNLTSEILQPSRVKSYAPGRKWTLEILKSKLKSQAESGEPVDVMDHFQHAMFGLLAYMCIGEKLDDKVISEIEAAQHAIFANMSKFGVLNILPRLGKIFFRNRWRDFLAVRRNQEKVFIPLIRARQAKKVQQQQQQSNEEGFIVSYVDTLLDLHLPDGGRKLSEDEMVSLCSEFVNAGTHTAPAVFQWIMANLVKNQDIQAKLLEEIEGVMRSEDEIKEEDLQKMPYLKAVVFEGLRRHPPLHFVLPHAVTEDTSIDGYLVPKNCTVNFLVAEISWDPKVWEDPMEFKPERFLSKDGEEQVCDITGNREVKMMPFGVGRRICPGIGISFLHLEYFVANLVREFKWTARDGDDVEMTPKQEFTNAMKYPLKAHITPRMK